jgi:lysophospholipase L1-like esterase
MGDANADWLAYGLEDAYSDNPDVGIMRKHRTDSGLISYDTRRDTDWAQVAREIIAVEKPKIIVMMIGNNDRQTIRETVPPAPSPSGAPKANAPPAPSATVAGPPMRPDLEQPPREAVERNPHMMPEQVRQATYGPWEFRSEKGNSPISSAWTPPLRRSKAPVFR